MAAKGSEDGRKRRSSDVDPRRSRAPFAIAIALAALVVASYWLYVRHQTAYFANRNLRLLAWSSAQLGESLERTKGYVRSFAQWGKPPSGPGTQWKSYRLGPDPTQDQIAKKYFPGFESLVRLDEAVAPAQPAPTSIAPSARSGYTETLVVDDGRQFLRIHYTAPGTAGAGQKTIVAEGEIPVDRVVEPVFRAGFLDAFDVLLLARVSGEDNSHANVVYALRPAVATSRYASDPTADNPNKRDTYKVRASNLSVTDLSQLETKALFHDPQPLSVAALSGATTQADVRIGGEDYLFFGQPFLLLGQSDDAKEVPVVADAVFTQLKKDVLHATSDSTPARPPAQKGTWIVGGLVSRSHFRDDALAISPSTVALVVALLLLVVCCWPFLRIALIGEFEHFTIADALAVGVGALIAISICTLLIGDVIAYRRMNSVADAHLKKFSTWFEGWWRTDLQRAADAFSAIEAITEPAVTKAAGEGTLPLSIGCLEQESFDVPPNVSGAPPVPGVPPVMRSPACVAEDALAARTPALNIKGLKITILDHVAIKAFPYVDSFSWLDKNGTQALKWSAGPEAPLASVPDRRYFIDARDQNELTFLCAPTCTVDGWPAATKQQKMRFDRFVLQSIHSATTGNAEAVLSRHTRVSAYPVLAMTLSEFQGINPLMPPSFGFAIIDDLGNVIFHSDPQRNGNENYFDESDHDRQLRAAVLARKEALVDIKYWGEDHRAYVRPMRGLPWTMIAFRDKRLLETMNVETLSFALLCLMCLSSLLVVGIIVCTLARPRYRAPWVWPSAKKLDRYRRLGVVFILLAVMFVLSIMALDVAGVVATSLLLPLVAIVSAYLVLRRGAFSRVFVAVFAVWLVLVLLVIDVVQRSQVDESVRLARG
ncbi:MAG TPA: cache domain-containing protein, partial [Thermoanaerobaculia bacterium]|nr:cache domain-containing protein [Thermoanaerobaculia bacterium]